MSRYYCVEKNCDKTPKHVYACDVHRSRTCIIRGCWERSHYYRGMGLVGVCDSHGSAANPFLPSILRCVVNHCVKNAAHPLFRVCARHMPLCKFPDCDEKTYSTHIPSCLYHASTRFFQRWLRVAAGGGEVHEANKGSSSCAEQSGKEDKTETCVHACTVLGCNQSAVEIRPDGVSSVYLCRAHFYARMGIGAGQATDSYALQEAILYGPHGCTRYVSTAAGSSGGVSGTGGIANTSTAGMAAATSATIVAHTRHASPGVAAVLDADATHDTTRRDDPIPHDGGTNGAEYKHKKKRARAPEAIEAEAAEAAMSTDSDSSPREERGGGKQTKLDRTPPVSKHRLRPANTPRLRRAAQRAGGRSGKRRGFNSARFPLFNKMAAGHQPSRAGNTGRRTLSQEARVDSQVSPLDSHTGTGSASVCAHTSKSPSNSSSVLIAPHVAQTVRIRRDIALPHDVERAGMMRDLTLPPPVISCSSTSASSGMSLPPALLSLPTSFAPDHADAFPRSMFDYLTQASPNSPSSEVELLTHWVCLPAASSDRLA